MVLILFSNRLKQITKQKASISVLQIYISFMFTAFEHSFPIYNFSILALTTIRILSKNLFLNSLDTKYLLILSIRCLLYSLIKPFCMSTIIFLIKNIQFSIYWRAWGIYKKTLNIFILKTFSIIFVVPEAGLEPARSCPRGILSPLRLPFRHIG